MPPPFWCSIKPPPPVAGDDEEDDDDFQVRVSSFGEFCDQAFTSNGSGDWDDEVAADWAHVRRAGGCGGVCGGCESCR